MKNRNIQEYISGYVDGEGCFNVSFSRREKFTLGWETKQSFSVSQNENRAETLYQIQKSFKGAGFMRRDYSGKTLKYEVRSLNDLITKVIPHFDMYPLMSSKQKDFKLFKTICYLMQKDLHKNKKGLQKIVNPVCRSSENTQYRKVFDPRKLLPLQPHP
jgi:hypothetical protein